MLPRVLSRRLPAVRRGTLQALLAALALALVAGPLGAPGGARAAQPERLPAAERQVAGGRLDWGVKASFQTYVTGPIAEGSWSLSGGASTVGENQFRFHSATGGYDPETGALHAGYSGGVHFVGHRKDDGSHELDLLISNPSLSVSGRTGTLHADMRSTERGTGQVTEGSQVPLATVDLSGVDLRGGTQIAVTGAPTTLTERGATAFAGYYQAGDPLDPLSFTADSQEPSAPEDAEEEPEPEPAEEQHGADASEEAGALVDAAVDWGVRRTFREYVTGPVAEGAWELADGAEDGGALFRFPLAEGTLDPEAGTAEAAFHGAVRFAGNDLDLTLSAVRVEVADGTGTLFADIDPGERGARARDQPLVTFPAEEEELAPEDGLVVLAEVPAVLTGEGADAFAGLYPEGTEMDPLTLALAVTEDAALPPLPDLGAEPTAPAEPAADDAPTAEAAADDDRTPLYLAIGAGALLALAAAFPLVRRRRATPTAGPTEPTDQVTPSVNDEETPRS
ncbi:HtaA domain-containing protein [Streptomyces sedi]|uniref:Htaa domain protein n=1 Tax=Streptomyces sedi TaxID=555059 RepID=A0A5C4V5K9_9ACTN|nr:HtaA domain-containing protein [Streptomyces sedi]TNM31157.1 Htaa domain protein [Streptomyces sedi]